MSSFLFYGDTVRYPALRHEVPLEIIDAFLFVEKDGRAHVMTSVLERARVAGALPDAELVTIDKLGLFDLVEDGMPRRDAELEVAIRALKRWGVAEAIVPADFPLALADRLRERGVDIAVDAAAVESRRRVKNE